MAQQHLDRLSAVDASFLHQEGASTHMHIGGLALFAGPPPSIEEFLEHIEGRLGLVPRYRQKLAFPPLEMGRPLWIDDPSFNIEYHVRHTALPAPGDEEQRQRLVGRLFAQRLDRTKPLWEMWVVEGLADGRFAIVAKTHHALVDGVSGVDLMTMLFDITPEPREVEVEPWVPNPEPSEAELIAAGVRELAGTASALPRRAVQAATSPASALASLRETLSGIGEVARAGLSAAPDTPLNVAIGPHRRFASVDCRLEDFKLVKNALGGTINDVVLTVVAGALARWMRSRGVPVAGLEPRACVPISLRSDADHGALGNRLAQVVAPLPVSIDDPVERLRAVREAMDGIKESRQAAGAEAIASMENFAPPTILAQASRLNFSARFYNLLVTNIPGPQFPLYVLGRELESMTPVPFLAGERALAVAIMSYNGGISFGLLGDFDALPDLDRVAWGIEDALAELVRLARGGGNEGAPRQGRSRARRPSRPGAAG